MARVVRVQDEVQTHTNPVSERGVCNPLVKTARGALRSGLFQKVNTVDRNVHACVLSRKQAFTFSGGRPCRHLEILLGQIGTWLDNRQISDDRISIVTASLDLSLWRILELKSKCGIGECQPARYGGCTWSESEGRCRRRSREYWRRSGRGTGGCSSWARYIDIDKPGLVPLCSDSEESAASVFEHPVALVRTGYRRRGQVD